MVDMRFDYCTLSMEVIIENREIIILIESHAIYGLLLRIEKLIIILHELYF